MAEWLGQSSLDDVDWGTDHVVCDWSHGENVLGSPMKSGKVTWTISCNAKGC